MTNAVIVMQIIYKTFKSGLKIHFTNDYILMSSNETNFSI